MENLTYHFHIPLYEFIFEEEQPFMSRGEMEVMSEIAY